MQPMVTQCFESIALWKRLMKSIMNALYFQELTLPVYISLKNSPLQERRDFPESLDEKSIWLKAANHRKKWQIINKIIGHCVKVRFLSSRE